MTKDILIVDDQPGIRLLLTDILTQEGYRITTASDGQEAIDKLKEKKYNLLIIDYRLPILDGVEVLQIVADWGLDISAVLMSGIVENINKEVSQCPKVKKILAKPFNVVEIKNIVRESIS